MLSLTAALGYADIMGIVMEFVRITPQSAGLFIVLTAISLTETYIVQAARNQIHAAVFLKQDLI